MIPKHQERVRQKSHLCFSFVDSFTHQMHIEDMPCARNWWYQSLLSCNMVFLRRRGRTNKPTDKIVSVGKTSFLRNLKSMVKVILIIISFEPWWLIHITSLQQIPRILHIPPLFTRWFFFQTSMAENFWYCNQGMKLLNQPVVIEVTYTQIQVDSLCLK
jgi:hypothetical protein